MSQKDPTELSSSTHSTYPVQENNRGFTFTTDQGHNYIIAFERNINEFPTEPFGENCVTIELVRIPTIGLGRYALDPDPKIEATVIKLIGDLFEGNPLLVINYTCDLSGDLERHRRITFGRWYLNHFESTGILRIHYDNQSQRVYAAALYHKDNPYKADIERVFTALFLGK